MASIPTAEERELRYQQADPAVQDLYNDPELGNALRQIFNKYRFHEDMYDEYVHICGDIILGFARKEDFAQMCRERLGLPAEFVQLLSRDFDTLIFPMLRTEQAAPSTLQTTPTPTPAPAAIPTPVPPPPPPVQPTASIPIPQVSPAPEQLQTPPEPSFYGPPPRKASYNSMLDVPNYGGGGGGSQSAAPYIPPVPPVTPAAPTYQPPAPQPQTPSTPSQTPAPTAWGNTSGMPAASSQPTAPQWTHTLQSPASPSTGAPTNLPTAPATPLQPSGRVFDRDAAIVFDEPTPPQSPQ